MIDVIHDVIDVIHDVIDVSSNSFDAEFNMYELYLTPDDGTPNTIALECVNLFCLVFFIVGESVRKSLLVRFCVKFKT